MPFLAIETLLVEYSCNVPRCRVQNRSVRVIARDPKKQNAGQWLDYMAEVCGRDHAELEPDCSGQTCDIKIPHPIVGAPLGTVPKH